MFLWLALEFEPINLHVRTLRIIYENTEEKKIAKTKTNFSFNTITDKI